MQKKMRNKNKKDYDEKEKKAFKPTLA